VAAHPLPLPPREQILRDAGEHQTLTSLADSYGVTVQAFSNRLSALGFKDEVKAAIRSVELQPPDYVPIEEVQAQRITELETALRKRREEDVYEERIKAVLAQAVEAWRPSYTPRPARRGEQRGKHEMALLWSDTHYPEVVDLEETNGINEFNSEIFWRRQATLRDRIASHVEQRKNPVDVLHLWALGDMLSGNIHEELAETNELPLAEATIQFGLDGARWVESLLEIGFRQIRFAGVVGNHPRLHKKPRAKHTFDNADWFAYHTMRLALAQNEAITFEIPKANRWPVVVHGWRFLLWHMDGVRSSMPGVPWGGIMRRVHALQNEYAAVGQPIDYFCGGHFHQLTDVPAGPSRIYVNGSVKGVDEHSLRSFGGGQPPQQALLTIHPDNGVVGGPAYLDLEPVTRASDA
jgi:hypothetical protein